MLFEELDAINRVTLAIIAQARARNAHVPAPYPPYYGYFDVDIFECPPFIMFTNNDSPSASFILCNRRFEPQSMKLWCRLCHVATGILDIGANVGIYSLCAALLRADLQIHAFEPNPYANARLRMHKMINELTNIVEHSVIVGNTNRMSNFGWVIKPGGAISSGGHLWTKATNNAQLEETIVAHMIALDDMDLHVTLGAHPLIKIDVEGSELFVVQGMSQIVALKPDILIETFSSPACDALNEIFLPLGYRAYLIEESTGRLVPRDRLYACSPGPEGDYNQFLTVRPAEEIENLMG